MYETKKKFLLVNQSLNNYIIEMIVKRVFKLMPVESISFFLILKISY